MKNIYFVALFAMLLALACEPQRDDEIQVTGSPAKPNFSIEPVQGDSNRFVVRDLSESGFQRLWDFPGGLPRTSVKAIDTVLYSKKGAYKVSLYTSQKDGNGTSFSTKDVVVLADAPLSCSPKYALLTGDCNDNGKCWTLSHEIGAVKVGPTYDDYSWYTSPVNGLQNDQYDDGFCFTFENLVFQNKNNGKSVNPWAGYQPQSLDPGISSFVFLEGTGILGRDQILLTDDQFMGVWDCDNLLDVVKLTATELIVRGKQRAQDGAPLAQGWFELRFVPQ